MNLRFGNSCQPWLVNLWYISILWSLSAHDGMNRFTVSSIFPEFAHTHRASCSTSLRKHSTGIHDYYADKAIARFLRSLCILYFILYCLTYSMYIHIKNIMYLLIIYICIVYVLIIYIYILYYVYKYMIMCMCMILIQNVYKYTKLVYYEIYI